MTNDIMDGGSGTQARAPQVDLEAYFARIGYQGPRDATLATLRAIHLLHPQAIPFENLDPLMYRPVPLDLDSRIRTIMSTTNRVDFRVELVGENLGVAFLPRRLTEQCRCPGLSAVLLAEPKTESRFAVVWHQGAYLSPAAKAWLRLLDEFLGKTKLDES